MTSSALVRLVIVTTIFGFSIGCSKKTKSQDVGVEVTPSKPIVFNADTTVSAGQNQIDVSAPWFKFSVKINNQSTDPILIINLKAEASITNGTGQTATGESTFDPSLSNYTIEATATEEAIPCTYNSFGLFPPRAGDAAAEPIRMVPSENADVCSAAVIDFYLDGLPDGGEGNYRYSIKLSPIGYFVNAQNEPADRFERSITFRTQ